MAVAEFKLRFKIRLISIFRSKVLKIKLETLTLYHANHKRNPNYQKKIKFNHDVRQYCIPLHPTK